MCPVRVGARPVHVRVHDHGPSLSGVRWAGRLRGVRPASSRAAPGRRGPPGRVPVAGSRPTGGSCGTRLPVPRWRPLPGWRPRARPTAPFPVGSGHHRHETARPQRPGRFRGRPGHIRHHGGRRRLTVAVAGRVLVPPVVIDQVGAVAFRRGVLGIGDQEFARTGEPVGVPAGIKRSLPEYQVRIAGFPHPQAYADVHLRADGGIAAHGCLGGPLGGGYQVHPRPRGPSWLLS